MLSAQYLLPLPLLPGKAISKMAALVPFTLIKLQVAWELEVCDAGRVVNVWDMVEPALGFTMVSL